MWKHQVQDTLLKRTNTGYFDLYHNLNKAPCFYFGEVEKTGVIYNETRVRVFDILPKTPYENICFEFAYDNTDTSKYFVYVECKQDAHEMKTYTIYTFVRFKGSKEWEFIPLVIIIYEATQALNYLEYNSHSKTFFPISFEEAKLNPFYGNATIASAFSITCARLLTCRNITYETIPAPETLNKKRKKNNKPPITDYHILTVDLSKSYKKYLDQHAPSKNTIRVHLCRGHFKEYGENNKLFGKYTGCYWWQPMVRGDKKKGILNKDYSVKIESA